MNMYIVNVVCAQSRCDHGNKLGLPPARCVFASTGPAAGPFFFFFKTDRTLLTAASRFARLGRLEKDVVPTLTRTLPADGAPRYDESVSLD